MRAIADVIRLRSWPYSLSVRHSLPWRLSSTAADSSMPPVPQVGS